MLNRALPTLGLPWRMPFFRPLNGFHPLVASFVEDNAAVGTVTLVGMPQLTEEGAQQPLVRLATLARHVAGEELDAYVRWLHLFDQASIEAQAAQFETLFVHTTPLYVGSKPWVFHFESFPSLFMPFMFTGATAGIDLQAQGFFKLVREAFESPRCRAIFTHIKGSREVFAAMFDSPAILRKLHHVPLGIAAQPASLALEKFYRPGHPRILFTNSLHQDPRSFYLRGGHHVLKAFQRIRRDVPDAELTILSSVPSDFEQNFSAADLTGVRWISRRVDDAALEQLFLDHHFFALPAAGLHSYSLLRALSHGCVPIVSDALGYEEYTRGIEDSVLTVRGVRDLVYRREPGGWFSDDYAPFVEPWEALVEQIHRAVVSQANAAQLRKSAARNLEHCVTHFGLPASQQAFNTMLADAAR